MKGASMHPDEKTELLRINAALQIALNEVMRDRDRWKSAAEAGKRALDLLRQYADSTLTLLP